MSNAHPDFIWLTGRETHQESTGYGEVVVPLVAIRSAIGISKAQGNLPHGVKARVVDVVKNEEEERDYFRISAQGIEGWIPEPFAARRWSTFTFLARLHDAASCGELDTQSSYAGMELIIRQNSFAIVTQGDPAHFDAIASAVAKLSERVTSAQAPLSAVPLRVEFINWVEIPADGSESVRTVGFMPMEEKASTPISNQNIETAMTIVPRMAEYPFLDLALNDFVQSLQYPRHALIFLSRAIESVERHFEPTAHETQGMGRERIMQQSIDISASDVEYVIRRANESHRRHASPEGKAEELSHEELVECYKKTGLIIASFADYLG